MRYNLYHNDKVFVFEGEGVKVQDASVHALMQKIKRLKIGVEEPQNVQRTKRKGAHTS